MSNAAGVREATPGTGDWLSAEEIGAAFTELSDDDKLKLYCIETVFRGGTDFGPNDLVHEAVCRALMGDRHCPRSVPLVAFLVETMRSIAHHDRQKRRQSKVLSVVPRHSSPTGGLPDCPADQLTPEEHLIEKQAADTVTMIHDRFADDPDAQLVLMGWADGLRGQSLREATGLDQSSLDYAGKRIRSRMRKLFPSGWTS